MGTRAGEHLNYIKKLEGERSAIAEHYIDNQHRLSSADFRLLSAESDYHHLYVL